MSAFLPDYYDTIFDAKSKQRYTEKLKLVKGIDPYAITKKEWLDDVDLWPAITHIHVCMYLMATPSPYTATDLLNYKSLDFYQNFVRGWVRQVLVKSVDNKRIVIGKVRIIFIVSSVFRTICIYKHTCTQFFFLCKCN